MPDLDVIIVGGGIAGLATAYRLQRAGLAPLVLAAEAVGGRMRTERRDGYLIDTGADVRDVRPVTSPLFR